MTKYYPTAELAGSLGVTVMTVTRRAKRESWPFRTRQGRGGGKEFAFDTLPESVKTAILKQEACTADVCPISSTHQGPTLDSLSDKKRATALARADLVALYTSHLSKAKRGGKVEARTHFISAYKAGAWPQLLETLGAKISWQTIERWKVALRKEQSVVALADGRGKGNAARTVITDKHEDILLKAVLNPNSTTISESIDTAVGLMKVSGLHCPSEKTMRRWLKKWKETHFGTWVYTREGKKAWNDKAAFFIERDLNLIEVGDIMVADGHVLNFETLNPWTGKAQRMELVMWYDMASNCPLGWEIMPTENTQSIASAFRRACISLGKYPRIAYLDNGRAFRSKYFNGTKFEQTGISGLFQELGVQTIFAWPYHGQSKTVERFFGTLHQLEQWVPSYVGNCIDNKPPRLHRGETMHRKAYEGTGGRPLTMTETHVAVARWIDRYINRPQRGHLDGRCPAEVFIAGSGPGVDEGKLRHLMMVKEMRKVSREGIKLFGERYYAPELYSRTHAVQIRYDMHDMSCIHVYRDGEFICTAPKVAKVHPAANILGDEGHQNEFKKQITYRKQQEKDAAGYVKGVLESSLKDQQQRIKELDVKTNEKPEDKQFKPLSQAKITRIEAAKAKAMESRNSAPAYIPPAENPDILSELEKYEYLFSLVYRDNLTLREPDQEWMEYFEATEEYENIKARCEQRKRFYARKQATN